MSNKTFCPIMTIGFNPPEKGKRDNRLCMKDCAWYDVQGETCRINTIAEAITAIDTQISDIADYAADMALKTITESEFDYDDYEFDQRTGSYYSTGSKRT